VKFFLLIDYFSLASTIILLFSGIIFWNKLHGNIRLIFCVVIASILADAISLLLINQGINSWPVINLFFLVQFSLFSLVLRDGKKITFIEILSIGCVSFGVIDFLFLQTPVIFNSYTSYICGILMILLALRFLYNLMDRMPVERIQALPLFWVAFSALIYFGGTLFLFLFNNYLIAHLPKSHQGIWILHNLLNITKNIFLFVALWVNYKSKTSPA
jgi:hypothetical protein